jgi:CRISPR system Cascade subunit CasE
MPLRFGAVLFEGRLEVTDRELFLTALREGIGSGKAFGFGLLSVAGGR